MFLIAASGARFLAMNPDARVFFSEDNPPLLALGVELLWAKRLLAILLLLFAIGRLKVGVTKLKIVDSNLAA